LVKTKKRKFGLNHFLKKKAFINYVDYLRLTKAINC